MELKTERLVLKKVALKDVADLIMGLNNYNVSGLLSEVPFPYTEKDAKSFISHVEEKLSADKPDSYQLNVFLEGKIIGGCGIGEIDYKNQRGDIGYWISEENWRRGYAIEASKEMLRFAFEELELEKITLRAYCHNEGSNAVAKKLGFSLEGVLRKHHRPKPEEALRDVNTYSLLKEEWEKLR